MNANENDSSKRLKAVNMNLTHTYTGVPVEEYDSGRDEKPWQRVLYEITRKGKHLYEPVKSVPSTLLVILLGVYLLLGYLTQLVEDDMPRIINDADVARDNSDTFSEETAWRYLHMIVGDEPRVAGTEYHLNKTVDMKTLVDSIAAGANQVIRTDWQLVSGDYFLNSSAPFVNYYQNASNIIAVLEGESGFHDNGTTGSSILINCHYDSVPYALGASDNVVFCAAMAETLNKLSRRQEKFKHNIIFLFNGAEENPLQASHAFLHHPWSKGITTVVNLDSAGMNGKAAIFQVTDPRVLNAYKRSVYRPNAQGLGEFLFLTGIIPSDTDFRIWRDFGQFYGIDVAFTKWGHVYHTRHDRPALLQPGVLQWAGDMLLALLTELADMQQLDTKAAPTAAVYYDYLNVFLITYSFAASYAVDIMIALFALTSVGYYVWLVGPRMSTVQELLLSVVGRVACVAAGILAVAIFVLLMVATTVQLRYLTQPWIVVPLYWMPYLISAVAVSQLYDAWRTKKSGLNRSIRTLQAMAATRLILLVVLLVLVCVPSFVTVRYLISAPLFIMSLTSLVSLTVVRYVRMQAWLHLILEVSLSLPSAMFMLSLALRLDAMVLPTMGRSASRAPDYTAALINAGLAAIVASTVSGMELLFSRKRLWLVLTAVGAICIVLMFTPFAPYWDDGPSTQRHYWFHTEITTYNAEKQPTERTSGILVTKHDAYTTDRVQPALRAAGLGLAARTDFGAECARRTHCNLPLYRTSFARQLPNGLFLYTAGPAAPRPPAPAPTPAHACAGDSCTYRFNITGAPHNMLTIWPHANINLTSWTLSAAPVPSSQQLERPVYVVFHSTATYSEVMPPFQFNVTFTVPPALQGGPIMDFSHHSHWIQHPQYYTTEYKTILEAMPRYFNIASFLSFRDNYVF